MTERMRLLRSKLSAATDQLRFLPMALGLAWRSARSWTLAWILVLLAQGVLPVGTVYLTKLLVDDLAAALGSDPSWEMLRGIFVWVGLMVAVMLCNVFAGSMANWIRTAQSELVQDHIRSLIHGKSVTVDLAFYESSDYYDHLHRARDEASYRPVALLESLGGLLRSGVTLGAMMAVLIPFGLWLPIALFASTLPAVYVVLRYSLQQHDWRLRTTFDQRRTWYYDGLLTGSEPAAELRLFALHRHFQDAFNHLRSRLRSEKLDLEKRQGLAQLGAGVVGLAITGTAMGWMVWRALHGVVTLGDLALFYQAFNQGQNMMRTLLDSAGQIYYNVLFLGNLFEFLGLEARVTNPVHPIEPLEDLTEGILFQNVSFSYPNNPRRLVLDHFDLKIPAGQIVAVVGRNGAGKSTILKLLCRFYDVNEGRITLDGKDLRDFRLEHLRRLITVLFQEPVHYHTSAFENIALGDLQSASDLDAIRAAAKAAGANGPIERLPQSYETTLGTWFGGIELSVGEWQRIALARAFLRQSPIIILDEPTSAMDSWAEADWMKRFRKLAAGRTAIIITHRFTMAMQADLIHVMDAGRIIESGRHSELVALDGHYAESWKAQWEGQ